MWWEFVETEDSDTSNVELREHGLSCSGLAPKLTIVWDREHETVHAGWKLENGRFLVAVDVGQA